MKRLSFLPLLAALICFSYPSLAVDTFHSDQRIVGTYYFYWYDNETSLHISWLGKDCLTHHPPEGPFSYREVSWHERELRDMIDAGIDFLLPVYWGDSTNTFWSIAGLDALVQAERDLIAKGQTPPKIGMFFDTTALMLQWHVSGHPNEKPNLSTPAGKELFYGMIRDFYSHVPPDLWARIDGAAMTFLYSAGWVSDYDQSLVNYTKTRFREDFNASIFLVRERSWRIETDMQYGWGAAFGPVLLDVASVGPGFENVGAVNCYGQSPLHRDRLGGYAYQDDWEKAMRSGSKIVTIETWNELHEGTDICETRETGRLYIELTRRYSTLFKEGSWNRSMKEIDASIQFRLDRYEGRPGELIPLDLRLVNTGWHSWPDYLDLGLFWLNRDAREHSKSRVIRLEFGSRIPSGGAFETNMTLKLPSYDGTYDLLVSTSYLGKRFSVTVKVAELAVPPILYLQLFVLLIRRDP